MPSETFNLTLILALVAYILCAVYMKGVEVMITTFVRLDHLVLYLEETTVNLLASAGNCGLF